MFGIFKKNKASEDEPLELVFVPALVVLLVHRERDKGAPLTQAEVEAVRDSGVCISMRRSLAIKMADERGYPDIRPENAWSEWSQRRAAILKGKSDV